MSIEIPIIQPTIEFKKHLSLEGNTRIIFSAPFGSGKTYFLRSFFQKETNDYEIIHLFPVNYSVASNEDIFELIKYDILFALLGKHGIELEKIDFNNFFILQNFLHNNLYDLIKPLVEMASKVGKGLTNLVESLSKLEEKYKSFKRQSGVDEEQSIIAYLKRHKTKSGSIYEEDAFTELICKLINQLKSSNKKIILVLDDLDRIDPEHLFRILNVFAAHFDIDGNTNKFDFDKIILVGDEQNIRNIFHHKYGIDTDFNGYLNKFYSQEVFSFENTAAIIQDFTRIIKSISKAPDNFKKNNVHYEVITFLLTNLVYRKIIHLRTLIKLRNSVIDYKDINIPAQYPTVKSFMVEIFSVLSYVLGSNHNLDLALKKLSNYELSNDVKDRTDPSNYFKLEALLPILAHDTHQFSRKDASFTFDINGEAYSYTTSHYYSYDAEISYFTCKLDNNSKELMKSNNNFPFFKLLLDAYQAVRVDLSLFS